MLHDSQDRFYRLPTGPVPVGGRVLLRIDAPEAIRAYVRLWVEDRERLLPMKCAGNGVFERELTLTKRGVTWYYFRLMLPGGKTVSYGNPENLGGAGKESVYEPASYQITVYDPEKLCPPEWMRSAVMYQIFLDRFACSGENGSCGRRMHASWDEDPVNERTEDGDSRADDFFGGDLKGIESRLDYLSGLGITALYLNPIFASVSNHRYNTADYSRIDPMLGTEKDFEELCREAQKRGIRVILDGVFSHTGSDSVYFNKNGTYGAEGAYRSRNSKYASWYSFTDWPDEYECWWGFKTLPNVNENDPSFTKYIAGPNGILRRWLEKGASGWRLDVADELPVSFIGKVKKRIKSFDPDAALIGEVWEDPSRKVAYGELRCYCDGTTLDGTMNYPLRDMVIAFFTGREDAEGFVRRYRSMCENIPRAFLEACMNLLGSHDKPRIISVLANAGNMEPERRFRRPVVLTDDEYRRGKRRFIAAWKLICSLPGMPCLYYGDEAGMTGMSDPYNRGTYPWGGEDKELTEAIRSAILERNSTRVLTCGDVRVEAAGKDILVVTRFREDAEQDGPGTRIYAFNRSAEDKTYEGMTIPAEGGACIR